MKLTDLQKRTIKGIVRSIESVDPATGYAAINDSRHDAGILSYGIIQFTLKDTLEGLLQLYCQSPMAQFSNDLIPYFDRLSRKDASLRTDENFKSLLVTCANDPAMRSAQEWLDEVNYLRPALNLCDRLGLKSAIGALILYDSCIQSGSGRTSQHAEYLTGKIGTAERAGEVKWLSEYLLRRKAFLKSLGGDAARSTYRPDGYLKLLSERNYGLHLPLKFRNHTITEANIPGACPPVQVKGEQFADRLLFACEGLAPAIKGEDVKLIQEALLANGFDLGRAGADGIFGRRSSAAVLEYQKQCGLPASGVVDRVTRQHLTARNTPGHSEIPEISKLDQPLVINSPQQISAPGLAVSTAGSQSVHQGENPIWLPGVDIPPRSRSSRQQINADGLKLIIAAFPARPKAYRVADQKFAIGFRHLTNVEPGMTINRAQAYDFLYEDLSQVETTVGRAVRLDLNENQFSALVVLAFDLEPKNFQNCSVVKALNQGDIPLAMDRWNKFTRFGADRELGLLARRNKETALFLRPAAAVEESLPTTEPAIIVKPKVAEMRGRPTRNNIDDGALVHSRTVWSASAASAAGVGVVAEGVTGTTKNIGEALPDLPAQSPPNAPIAQMDLVPSQSSDEAYVTLQSVLDLAKATLNQLWTAIHTPGTFLESVWSWTQTPGGQLALGISIIGAVSLIAYARIDDWSEGRR